jgi:hypothetical protein
MVANRKPPARLVVNAGGFRWPSLQAAGKPGAEPTPSRDYDSRAFTSASVPCR